MLHSVVLYSSRACLNGAQHGLAAALVGGVLLSLGCSKKSEPIPAPPAQAAAESGTAAQVEPRPPSDPRPAPSVEPPRMLTHLAPAWGDQGRLPPEVGIPVGQLIPNVSGTDTDGKQLSLRDAAKQHAPLVLIFYRGGFCGFAAYFLRAIAVQDKAFRDSGAKLVMITPDTVDKVALTRAAHQLDWPMLSDAELTITKAFHLEHTIDDKDIADATRYKMALPAPAGGEKVTLTNPAVFVVDAQGKVKFAHAETRSDKMLTYSQILDGIKQSVAAKP